MTKKLPKIISQEEFEKLVKHTQTLMNKKGISKKRKNQYQEYLIAMVLGFEAGMRISEILGWKDKVPVLIKEQFEGNYIRVISGKGGKDRVVPKPKRITPQIINNFPLTIQRRALQFYIVKIGKEILNKKMSFHTLRHGFGSHLAGKGLPLHEIQMLMGHSRLDTTGIYLHANPQETLNKVEELF